jgi:hypothetical protein
MHQKISRMAMLVMLLAGSTLSLGEAIHAQVAGWRQITPASDNVPLARYDHALTGAGDTLVLFGGRASGALGDTWIYDVKANLWREVKASPSPEPRWGMATAYDAERKRVLLFGGQASGFFNDVWAFDLAAETWSKLDITGAQPETRYGTSAVIDPEADVLLISHGFTSEGRFDDTWALDLKTNTWQDVSQDISPSARPLKRCLHEAAFDVASRRMILYGGCSSGFGPCPQGDLWAFDPAAKTWAEIKGNGFIPTARSNPSLVNEGTGTLWLFGGKTAKGHDSELWSLDAKTGVWTLRITMDGPTARSSHDATWDALNKQLIVFGGSSDAGPLNDLWAFKP